MLSASSRGFGEGGQHEPRGRAGPAASHFPAQSSPSPGLSLPSLPLPLWGTKQEARPRFSLAFSKNNSTGNSTNQILRW